MKITIDRETETLCFQALGIIACVVGTLLIFRGPRFFRYCVYALAFCFGYFFSYKFFDSPYFNDHVLSNIDKNVGILIVLLAPIAIGLMFSRLVKQSLYYILVLLRFGTFSVAGYSLFTLVIEQLTNQSWINHSMPFLSINFSNHITVEQNIILTVLAIASVLYLIWLSFKRHPLFSSFILVMIIAFVSVLFMEFVPELNQMFNEFLNEYSYVIEYLLQHTSKVSIDVSFYVSLIGTLLGVIIGLNFNNDIVEQGLSMVLGCILMSIGVLSIYSKNNLTMVVLTVGLLMLGFCRRYYVPSERRLRYIAKMHAKRVWRTLEEKQRQKYEKLIHNATIKSQKRKNSNFNNVAMVGTTRTAANIGDTEDEAHKQHSSRKQRKKGLKTRKNKDGSLSVTHNNNKSISKQGARDEDGVNSVDSGYSAGTDELNLTKKVLNEATTDQDQQIKS